MASLITERDLNSEELINALKCIETESVDLVRYQLLLDENQRLRNELVRNDFMKFEITAIDRNISFIPFSPCMFPP